MSRKNVKSGQAAMEFLMTYGWAILVVLVVIGALAYFGVLNPESFLPRRCILGSEITCPEFQLLDNGEMQFLLGNGIANKIKITNVVVDDTNFKNMVGNCAWPATTGLQFKELNPGEQTKKNEIKLSCTGNLNPGTPVRAYVTVTYTDMVTTFDHTAKGDMIVKVEPTPPAP